MSIYFEIITIAVAVFCALIFAYFISLYVVDLRIEQKSRTNRKHILGIDSNSFNKEFISEGFALKILNYLLKINYEVSSISISNRWIKKFIKSNNLNSKIKKLSYEAHMPHNFGNWAFREAQFRIMIIAILISIFIGLLVSYILMFLLLVTAIIVSYYLPIWALKQEKTLRQESLEKNLPEMLDVIALGMRSGLSFERAFSIYTQHFNCELSKECYLAQQKWENGILTREEALKNLNSYYSSVLLDRVINNIIRSLRFGSSLVNNLEEASTEARNLYKTKRQEVVSKAPVKMMIPTGTLILPAMLILVLGPILLELFSGF